MSNSNNSKNLTEQKEQHRLGTINKWDVPEAPWAANYDWTRHRGPKPWPVPSGWVFKNPEGGGWWRYYGDRAIGNHTREAIVDELKEDDTIAEPYKAVEETRGPDAHLSSKTANPDEVSLLDYEDEKLEWKFKVDDKTVFRRVEPTTADLMAAVAEGLQAYHDGELEERIDEIIPTSGSKPEGVLKQENIERRQEENKSLSEFTTQNQQQQTPEKTEQSNNEEVEEEEHTLIHVICDECGECDMLTLLQHPRKETQTKAVSKAHHTVADDHADESGHHVEVGVTTGSPEEIRSTAQSMADAVDGAEPEDFSPEMITDGGQPKTEAAPNYDVEINADELLADLAKNAAGYGVEVVENRKSWRESWDWATEFREAKYWMLEAISGRRAYADIMVELQPNGRFRNDDGTVDVRELMKSLSRASKTTNEDRSGKYENTRQASEAHSAYCRIISTLRDDYGIGWPRSDDLGGRLECDMP